MDTRFTIELRSKRREELPCKVHRDLHSSLRMYIADGIDLTWRPLPKCMSMSTTTTIKTSVTTQLGFKWWLENHLWSWNFNNHQWLIISLCDKHINSRTTSYIINASCIPKINKISANNHLGIQREKKKKQHNIWHSKLMLLIFINKIVFLNMSVHMWYKVLNELNVYHTALALQNNKNRNPKWRICLHHNPKWRIVLINSKWRICLHHNPKWRIVLIETLPREGICKSCTHVFILNFWKSKHTSKKSNYLTEMQYSIQLLVFVKITPKMNMVFETFILKIEDPVACLPEDLSVQLKRVCSFRSHQQKPIWQLKSAWDTTRSQTARRNSLDTFS